MLLPEDINDCDAYRRARSLTNGVYALLASKPPRRTFPPDERYALALQLRRASVSIPANIAEATGRSMPVDQARFIDIACGSATETYALLEMARDFGFADPPDADRLMQHARSLSRQLARLRADLRRPSRRSRKGGEFDAAV